MADFRVQRGKGVIPVSGDTFTLTAGVDYVAPASTALAFIRQVGANSFGSGVENSQYNGTSSRNISRVTNPTSLLTSVSVFRDYAGADGFKVAWEIPEYTGSVGGPNEWVVRHVESISVATGDLTIDSSVISGVVASNKVVTIITGVSSDNGNRQDYGNKLFTTEYVAGSSVARLTRSANASGSLDVSIAIIEFTGSNWNIQRIPHTYVASAVDESETIVAVSSLSKAFIIHQSSTDTVSSGPDGGGQNVWLNTTTSILFRKQVIDTGATGVAYVIENTQTDGTPMNVSHYSGTRANLAGGASPDIFTHAITAVADIAQTSIMGEGVLTTTTSDCHGGMLAFELTSTTAVTMERGRDEYNRDYRFSVVEWPTAPVATGFAYLETVTGAGTGSGTITTGALTGIAAGNLLVASLITDVADLLGITPPTGFTLGASYLISNRTIATYYKIADGTETTFSYTNTQSSTVLHVRRYSVASGNVEISGFTTGIATSLDTITVGPVTAASGDLVYAIAFQEGNTDIVSVDGYSDIVQTAAQNERLTGADKISSGGDESATFVIASTNLRQSAIIIAFHEIPAVTGFNAQRQAILDGLVSGNTALDDFLKATPVANVARTSDTEVTITVPALTVDIASDLTVVPTIPGSALALGSPIVSSSFTILATVGGVSAIVGDTTYTFTPAATLSYTAAVNNYSIVGDTTYTFTPAATLSYRANHEILGDTTYTFTPAATLSYSSIGSYSIVGDTAYTFTHAATLDYTANSDIVGDTTYTFTSAATLNYRANHDIIGDTTYTFTPASTMNYTGVVPSINGNVTYTFTPAATLDYTANRDIVGDTTYTFTPVSTLIYRANHDIVGSTTYTFTSAATLNYRAKHDIIGDTTYTFTHAAALKYTANNDIVGDTTYTFTSAATMLYAGNNAIVGTSSIVVTPAATMLYVPKHAIVGDSYITVTPGATMSYTGPVAGIVEATPQLVIAYDDSMLDPNTTVTGSGWDATDDEQMLRTTRFKEKALATQTTCTTSISLNEKRTIELVTIPRHTFSVDGTWRIRVSNNVTLLTAPGAVPVEDMIYDSKDINVWPDTSQYANLPYAEYAEFATETLSNLHAPPAMMFLPADTFAQYIHITFIDTITDYTISKLTVSPVWRPGNGLSPGWTMKYASIGKPSRLSGGKVLTEFLPKYRQIGFKCDYIPETEALTHLTRLDRDYRLSTPYVAILDASDIANRHRKYIYGTNNAMSPMQGVRKGFYKKTFTINEWL